MDYVRQYWYSGNRWAPLAFALWAMTTGCGRAASSPPSPSIERYDVVTVVRPPSLAKRFVVERSAYDACAATAKMLNLAVKPFIVLPADFIEERRQNARDGDFFYLKIEHYGINIEEIRLENGCLSTPLYLSETWTLRGARGESVIVDKDQQRHVEPFEPTVPKRFTAVDMAAYSIRKSVNGVSLRCLSADSPVIRGKIMSEMCILDGAGGTTMIDMNGEPVLAFFKDPTLETWTGLRTLEPLSLKIGQPIDARIFGQAEQK